MKSGYECARCGLENTFTQYTKHYWDTAVPQRCTRCGAAHACLRGEVEVISRQMMPSDHAAGVVSPWQPWKYRPVAHGLYECRFRSIEPETIFLYWNGTHFQAGVDDERVVLLRDLMAWRGVCA